MVFDDFWHPSIPTLICHLSLINCHHTGGRGDDPIGAVMIPIGMEWRGTTFDNFSRLSITESNGMLTFQASRIASWTALGGKKTPGDLRYFFHSHFKTTFSRLKSSSTLLRGKKNTDKSWMKRVRNEFNMTIEGKQKCTQNVCWREQKLNLRFPWHFSKNLSWRAFFFVLVYFKGVFCIYIYYWSLDRWWWGRRLLKWETTRGP
jgi:hypothetical protein